MANEGRIATLDSTIADRLPAFSKTLFDGKAAKDLSFEAIAKHLGRSEVAVAALFYGQATASSEDVEKLSEILDLPKEALAAQLAGFPNRGQAGPMPPTEPLIYRLYEIVQNYGYAYKAILNEKFGDGIMSAICFSTTVDKEVDEAGSPWVVITLKGKWQATYYSWHKFMANRHVQASFQSLLVVVLLPLLVDGSDHAACCVTYMNDYSKSIYTTEIANWSIIEVTQA